MEPVNGIEYTYIDAILALVPMAKFYPAETLDEIEWVDDRDRPTNNEIESKLNELQSQLGLFFLRKERDILLSKTDWVAGDDVPQSLKDKWYPYRQALRDITDHYTSLEDVVWPTKPE